MDFTIWTELISSFGFPIVCVVALAWFGMYMIRADKAEYQDSLSKAQDREDRLMEELKASREVNSKAMTVIAEYASKITDIQKDVTEIKGNIQKLI